MMIMVVFIKKPTTCVDEIEDLSKRVKSVAKFRDLGFKHRVLSFNIQVLLGSDIDACQDLVIVLP